MPPKNNKSKKNLLTYAPSEEIVGGTYRSREGIILDSPAIVCIVPLKIGLGKWRALEECDIGRCVFKEDAPNTVVASRALPSC
jgi:hypothetical protein